MLTFFFQISFEQAWLEILHVWRDEYLYAYIEITWWISSTRCDVCMNVYVWMNVICGLIYIQPYCYCNACLRPWLDVTRIYNFHPIWDVFSMMDYSILRILVIPLIHSLLSIVIVIRIDYNCPYRVIFLYSWFWLHVLVKMFQIFQLLLLYDIFLYMSNSCCVSGSPLFKRKCLSFACKYFINYSISNS